MYAASLAAPAGSWDARSSAASYSRVFSNMPASFCSTSMPGYISWSGVLSRVRATEPLMMSSQSVKTFSPCLCRKAACNWRGVPMGSSRCVQAGLLPVRRGGIGVPVLLTIVTVP